MLTVIVETKGKIIMKKTLIACAVAVAALTSVAVAGGYAPAPKASQTGVYIEGMVGGAYHVDHAFEADYGAGDWGYGPEYKADKWNHISWGWALGADLGYQFNQYVSAELGGFWVQKTTLKADKNNVWFQNWLGYFAGRIAVPVMDNFAFFGKFGVGMNHSRWTKGLNEAWSEDIGTSHNFFGPVFAAGAEYTFGASQNMGLSLQYMHFNQSWTTWDKWRGSADSIDLVTVGLSYRFAL